MTEEKKDIPHRAYRKTIFGVEPRPKEARFNPLYGKFDKKEDK